MSNKLGSYIMFGTVGLIAIGFIVMILSVHPNSPMPFGFSHDIKEMNKPTGEEAVVTILDNDDGCLFEINGERHISNLGLFIEDSCHYLEGEQVIAYKVQGGWWKVKSLGEEGT